ncbi:MAG: sterol desaturase family protein [Rhodopila sp.]|nr:sterol desaturase family protein [Rhodopila sp.]
MSAARLTSWLLLLGLIFVPLERLFALRPGRIFRAAFLTDLAYYFLNGIVPGLILSVPLAGVAWVGRRVMPGTVTAAFAHWPLGGRLFAALVVAEVGLYWGHRWSHEIPLLWRFHAIHHSPTHVDWLVNSRGHPVDFIFTRLCGLVPLYALGMATPLEGGASSTAMLVMLLGPIWGFFIHANLRWRLGPLEWLVATPAFHHWHHTNDGPAVIDKNYAPMFPWMDRIFGTLYLPKDRQPAVYGTNTPVPSGLAGQLLEPFAGPSRYGSIDSTASAAHSDGLPEDGRSKFKASANP